MGVSVEKEMFMMGLSPRHKGFHYLSKALRKAESSGCDVSEAIRLSDNEREMRQVERCMRYAIRYAWDMNEDGIRSLFPYSTVPPTPLEFVHAMLWRLDEESRRKAYAVG